jgi:citrate synthase
VDPSRGLSIRGTPVDQLTAKLPEEVLWLLLTGELPNESDLKSLQSELGARPGVPEYVWEVLRAMPAGTHPMTLLSIGVNALQKDAAFPVAYGKGMRKSQYWESTLEDSLTLIARIPELAAGIYRLRKGEPLIKPDSNRDWSDNFANMLGFNDAGFSNLMRLYMTLHCDHEGGNVSAHASHCVGSALSDVYRSVAAGLNGLAGPLHGLANQECLDWINELRTRYGESPTKEQVAEFATETLTAGQVVPGYGHAVLRVADPRFLAFLDFGRTNCKESAIFQCVETVYDVVPRVLKERKKDIANPWPNVDAASGALLTHYGLTDTDFYTVLFGVSRALGLCSQLVWSRALEEPIERPKSVTIGWIENQCATPAAVSDVNASAG